MSQSDVLDYLKKEEEAEAKEISEELDLSTQAVVNALTKLGKQLLVEKERHGIKFIWRLKNEERI